jgi:hypothetical protein
MKIICPRCKREAVGWPLLRVDVCAPKYWVKCLREPETIIKKSRGGTNE